MKNGWVKIHRQLMDKGYYADSHYIHLWVHLILKASYEEGEYMHKGKIHKLKKGQISTGRKKLSSETGINESKIERILKVFEREGQIEQLANKRFRVITILLYEHYQKNEQLVNNWRTTGEQLVNTIKEDKEDKEIKKYIYNPEIFERFWDAYDKKNGKTKTIEYWKKKKIDDQLAETIIERAKEYREATGDKNFMKDPERWIRDERWNDSIQQKTSKGEIIDFTKFYN